MMKAVNYWEKQDRFYPLFASFLKNCEKIFLKFTNV